MTSSFSSSRQSPGIVIPSVTANDREQSNAAAIRLLDEWMEDESGYDEETWPRLKKALNDERKRVGARRLFYE